MRWRIVPPSGFACSVSGTLPEALRRCQPAHPGRLPAAPKATVGDVDSGCGRRDPNAATALLCQAAEAEIARAPPGDRSFAPSSNRIGRTLTAQGCHR
jgi:hypothetical protein